MLSTTQPLADELKMNSYPQQKPGNKQDTFYWDNKFELGKIIYTKREERKSEIDDTVLLWAAILFHLLKESRYYINSSG